MKLTLRTLLAYINHLLPPKDTEEFEQLLNENKLANTFCQRVESVMKRPELGAPEIIDSGQYLDPNVTAEYLDNTLSADVSPEYEKLCLASDRQLAEVSACHHILAVVQTQPIEVENACRERVYNLPKVVQERTANSDMKSELEASNENNVSLKSGVSSDKPLPPIPDIPQTTPTSQSIPTKTFSSQNPQAALENYAQMLPQQTETQPQQRGINWAWVVAGVIFLVVIILALVLLLTRSKTDENRVAQTSVVQVPATQTVETSVPQEKNAVEQTQPLKQTDTTSKVSEESQTSKPESVPVEEQVEEQEAESNNTVSEQSKDTLKTPDSEIPADEIPADEGKTTGVSITKDSNVDTAEVSETIPEVVSEDVPDKNLPSVDKPTPTVSDTNPEPADEEKNSDTDVDSNTVADSNEIPEQSLVPLGQYLIRKNDEAQILLRKHLNQARTGIWNKVSERATILAGDTLIALPDYCSELVLGNNVRVRLVGPTRVFITPESTSKEIHLKLEYGSMTVSTLKSFDGKVVVQSSNMPTVIEQTIPSTKIAYQAMPMNIFDADPAVESTPYTGTISVLVGSVNVQYDGNMNTVDALCSIDTQTGTVDSHGDIPEWVTNKVEPLPEFNRIVNTDKTDKHIGVLLSEIGEQKGIAGAVRQKALVSMAMIGKYTDLIEDFNKEDKFSLWQDDFNVLQNAILISQLNAQMAKEELQKRYAEDGATIYDILWKYQDKTISPEDAQDILTCLKHDKLYVRVVAYCLLKSRGVQLGAYRPTDLKKSEKSLKAMEEKFKKGIE